LRDLRPRTQEAYVSYVVLLARHHQCDPAQLEEEAARSFLLFLRQERHYAGSSIALTPTSSCTGGPRVQHGRVGESRTCHPSAECFLQRFLQHVLPKGFHRVRHSQTLRAPANVLRSTINPTLSRRRSTCTHYSSSFHWPQNNQERRISGGATKRRLPKEPGVAQGQRMIHPKAIS
jgi:hypothetical protein